MTFVRPCIQDKYPRENFRLHKSVWEAASSCHFNFHLRRHVTSHTSHIFEIPVPHYYYQLVCVLSSHTWKGLSLRYLDRSPNFYASRICYRFVINTILDKFVNVPVEHKMPPFFYQNFQDRIHDSLPVSWAVKSLATRR